MSFKFLFLLFIFALTACGVKHAPVPPEGTNLPSYDQKFLGNKKKEKKKKEK